MRCAVSRLTALVDEKTATTFLTNSPRWWRHQLRGEESARADDGAEGWTSWRKEMQSCRRLNGREDEGKVSLSWKSLPLQNFSWWSTNKTH